MKAALDDDSDGVKEADALAADFGKAMREGNEADLRRGFADVLDTVHTSQSSSFWSGREPTQAELDELARTEVEVRAALSAKVTEALSSHGIRVVAVLDDGLGEGWIFHARDGAGRPYEAKLSFGAENALTESEGAVGMVDRMAGSVVRAVLGARDEYFRRMGAS